MERNSLDPLLSPDAALYSGRAAIEGGIPVIHTCKHRAKAAAFALLCAAMGLLCFATACQPTPAEDVVVNKNEGAFENAIAATPAASQATPYQAPAHLQYELTGLPENLQIVFDADVEIPTLTAYPVMELAPYRLTQADADNILNALLGGNALYEQTEQRSRAEIQQSIDYYQWELSLCEPEQAGLISSYQDILNELFQEYEAAEEQPSYALASRELKFRKDLPRLTSYLMSYGKEIKNGDGRRYEWTEEALAKAERDGNEGIRGVCFLESGRKMQVELYNGAYESANPYNASYVAMQLAEGNLMRDTRLAMTGEQAVERAQALLARMKLDFVPVSVNKETRVGGGPDQPESGAYTIVFKRNIPGTAASAVVGAQMKEDRYMPLLPPETLVISLDDYGLLGFHWSDPRIPAGIIQESAALLPFGEIQARIEQQLKVQNLWESQFGEDREHPVARRLEIDKITLSYIQLPKKDDLSACYYAPVWDVCGDLYVRFPDDYTEEGGGYLVDENNERELLHMRTEEDRIRDISVLTINAVDGSVAERFQGS